MAVGPLARLLAQVIVPVIAVVARALPAAYAQALQQARKAGGGSASTTASSNPFAAPKLSTHEARLILNVTEQDDVDTMERQYQKYMAANEVKKIPGTAMNTGSFYLQSKIYRAREALLHAQQQQKDDASSS